MDTGMATATPPTQPSPSSPSLAAESGRTTDRPQHGRRPQGNHVLKAVTSRSKDGTRVLFPMLALGLVGAGAGLSLGAFFACWVALLIISVGLPGRRLFSGVFLGLTCYCAAAWILAAQAGRYYPPFPSLELIESDTRLDLYALVGSYGISALLIGPVRFGAAIEAASQAITGRIHHLTAGAATLVGVLLGSVGLVDWLRITGLGISSVRSSGRRAFADRLLLSNNHDVQVVIIGISIVALSAIAAGRYRWILALMLVFCWTPYLLVGSRKEFLIVVLASAIINFSRLGRRGKAGAILITLGIFFLPAVSGGDIYLSLNEFILPQHMQFAIDKAVVPADFGGTFWSRAEFILPKQLRLGTPVDLGTAFSNYGVTAVGIGANPFAEFEMALGREHMWLGLAALITFFMASIRLASHRFPGVAVVAFAQLLILGRSDTWIAAFFVVYSGLVVEIMSRRNQRNGEHLPLGDEHGRPAYGASAISECSGPPIGRANSDTYRRAGRFADL